MTTNASYRVVIVDDDALQAKDLATLIARSPQAASLSVSIIDPDSFLSRLESTDAELIDILFCDIVFDGREDTGIDFVRKYFPQGCSTQVIYVTGYSHFHTQIYKTDHVCFLTKPFKQNELEQALELALRGIEKKAQEPLLLKFGAELHAIAPQDIRYAESELRIVVVHTANETIRTYSTLAELAAKLPASFIQCHKSYLVNVAFIRSATPNDIVMEDGTIIPISRRRRKETHDHLMRLIRSS